MCFGHMNKAAWCHVGCFLFFFFKKKLTAIKDSKAVKLKEVEKT